MSGITPYFVYKRHFGWIQYFRSPKILSVPRHHWVFHTHLAHVHQKRDNTWNTEKYPSEDRVPNRIFQQSYPTQTRPILKKTYPLGPWYRISQWHYQSRLNHSSCHLSNPETQSELKLENMSALTMDWGTDLHSWCNHWKLFYAAVKMRNSENWCMGELSERGINSRHNLNISLLGTSTPLLSHKCQFHHHHESKAKSTVWWDMILIWIVFAMLNCCQQF